MKGLIISILVTFGFVYFFLSQTFWSKVKPEHLSTEGKNELLIQPEQDKHEYYVNRQDSVNSKRK